MEQLEDAILTLVGTDSSTPDEVRRKLVDRGFSAREVRSAIAKLWDDGRLNFGPDKRLRLAPTC